MPYSAKRLGIALALTIALAPAVSARPERFDGAVYGLEHLSLNNEPISLDQLEKLEAAAPDQVYAFDPESVISRLDAGTFNPYLDTHPFKNKGTFASQGGTCYGMSAQILEWYQARHGQREVSRHAALRTKERGVHREAARTFPSEKPHLRHFATASEENALVVLKRAIELQPTSYDLGERPSPQALYEDYLLPDLANPAVGVSPLGFTINDSKGRSLVKHSILAIGLAEGTAASQSQKLKVDGKGIEVGAGHRVHAVRVELWDSNRPFVSENHAEEQRGLTHLIYFPKTGQFSFPRNSYYEVYEKHALSKYSELPGVTPAELKSAQEAEKQDRLLQPQATFLKEGTLITSASNTRKMQAIRFSRSLFDRSEAPMETNRRGVIASHDRVFGRGGVGANSSEAETYWRRRDDAVDGYVDEYLIETFKVRDVEAQQQDESVR